MDESDLLLLIWLSPAFPTGSFAYSHGLEWAVEARDVRNANGLADWIFALLEHGAARNDRFLLKSAWEAGRIEDFAALLELNELALALCPSAERYLEVSAQGNAFLSAVSIAWPSASLDRFSRELSGDAAYPVALGLAAGCQHIALPPLLHAYALNFCNLIVSSAVRLGITGQTGALKLLAACGPRIQTLPEPGALGTCAFQADLASMHHETQYSRLFRS